MDGEGNEELEPEKNPKAFDDGRRDLELALKTRLEDKKIIYQPEGDDENRGKKNPPFLVAAGNSKCAEVFFQKEADDKPGKKKKQGKIHPKKLPVYFRREKKSNKNRREGAKSDEEFAVVVFYKFSFFVWKFFHIRLC